MNDIKAVLFDLDGTLLDSMYVWQYVDEEFLRRRGITPPDDYGRQCSHRSFYETALYTIDLFNLPETPEQLMQEWTDLAIDEYRHNVKLKPFARETVELAIKSGYKTAVCTSQTPELYTPVLHHTGLWGMFETISSAAVFGAAEGLNLAKNANRPKISSGGSLSCKLSSPTAPSRLERRRPSAVSSRGKW